MWGPRVAGIGHEVNGQVVAVGQIEVEVAVEPGGDGTHAADRVELHVRSLVGGQVLHELVHLVIVDRCLETKQGELVQGRARVLDVVPAGTHVVGQLVPVLCELDGPDHLFTAGFGLRGRRTIGRRRDGQRRRHAHERVGDTLGVRHVAHRHRQALAQVDQGRGVLTCTDVAHATDHVDELDGPCARGVVGPGHRELGHVHSVLDASEHHLVGFRTDVVELQQRPPRLQSASRIRADLERVVDGVDLELLHRFGKWRAREGPGRRRRRRRGVRRGAIALTAAAQHRDQDDHRAQGRPLPCHPTTISHQRSHVALPRTAARAPGPS